MDYTVEIKKLKKLIKEGHRIITKFDNSKGDKPAEIVKQMNQVRARVGKYEKQVAMMEDTLAELKELGVKDIRVGGASKK